MPHPHKPKIDFDERLWPVNCLLFVLSGIVIGLVLGTSRFDDPRVLHNAAFRLGMVLLGIGALFFAAMHLREGIVRRVQLCVLISLLVHLGLGVYLHHKYLELAQRRQKDLVEEMANEYEFETIPDYDARRIERPDAEEAFEKPLNVRLPDGKEGQTANRAPVEHDLPARNEQTAEPEPTSRDTNPLQPRRAALSVPRRAEDAGSRLSRQEQRRELAPDTPVPQPEIERPEKPLPSTPTSDAAEVARRAPGAVSPRHRVSESQPRENPSPHTVAMDRRASERPRSSADIPSPARSQQETHDVAPAQIAERNVDLRDAPLRLTDSTASEPARQRLSPVTRSPSADQPAPPVEEQTRRPVAQARRANESISNAPSLRQAASTESPARTNTSGTLPSAARTIPMNTDRAAAGGTTPASAMEVTDRTAVGRSSKRSTPQRRRAAGGMANDAAGANRTPVHVGASIHGGARRPTGRRQPSLERVGAESGIARAPGRATAVADMPTTLPVPSPSVVAEAGEGGKQRTVAPGEVARAARGGARTLPVRSTSIGAGPAAVVGAPGRVSLADRRRVTRHEAIPSGVSGGGIPLPQRTSGRNLSLEATAEPATIASAAPTGSDGVGTPSISHLAGGARRRALGLPGVRNADQAAGAEPFYASKGTTEVLGPARREMTSPHEGRGESQGHTEALTFARGARGTNLPSTAAVVEASSEGGRDGSAGDRGETAGSLEPASGVSVRRVALQTPGGRRTSLESSPAAGAETGTVAVSIGRRTSNNRPGLVPHLVPVESALGRSSPGATLPVSANPEGTDNIAGNQSESSKSSEVAGVYAPSAAADGAVGRRRGGLPVRNSADLGPGGLRRDVGRDVGIPGRRAREESLLVHNAPRRFLLARSGMQPTLDAAASEPTEFFRRRDPDTRGRWVEQYGGSPSAERAVELGLAYLAREQFDDGHWSLDRSPRDHDDETAEFGQMSSDTAATGLALLSFFGAGYTHLDEKHRNTVRAAVDWLVRNQRDDGNLFTGGSDYVWLYSHGIAAIALCEAYGMTGDPALREPAERAIKFIVRAQNESLGGWRYQPGQESDTSVSGWQLMAMKSAMMAGLQVPDAALARTQRWLDVAQSDGGSRYAYNPYAADTPQQRPGRSPNLAMTAEGLLMRLYLGWEGTDERVKTGAEHLLQNLPELDDEGDSRRDAYYWYYASQVMFHIGGEQWNTWNTRLRPLLEKSQTQDGTFAGSWSASTPAPDRWGHAGGRHYVTTMHLLMLEVYYRHLPLFQSGAAE